MRHFSFRTFGLAFLSLFAALAQPAWAQDRGYALLVGVNEYEHAQLSSLSYAENDVNELSRLLNRPGSPFSGRVRLLTTARGRTNPADQPTAANIRRALTDLVKDRGKKDSVLLALAGHGIQLVVRDPDEQQPDQTYGYFCPSDAQLSPPSFKTGRHPRLIHLKDLLNDLGDCGAGSKMVLVDACRNELKLRGRSLKIRRDMVPEGVAALFSCSSGEVAHEVEKLRHGMFFHFVLEGLRGKARNRRGEISWNDLAGYVTDAVADEAPRILGQGIHQRPQLIANQIGRSPVLVGWIRLFNGKDLTGWKVFPEGTGQWRVEEGVLTTSGATCHLFSERGDYRNFRFRVECQINDRGNGGQLFRAQFEPGFPVGYEAQINANHSDPIRTGSLHPRRNLDMRIKENIILQAPHEPNEWFTQEVICQGARITILVNGKKTVEWTDPKERFEKGHFALQHHHPGSVIKFRKIEVLELPD